ncbi:TetR/AcrR family transcriptional regulator [Achromobacter sp. ES-001]|uniref:TetR/AcrR family transcriptional regulator n=1 Tax=unclassified Achromobacter TaxID=2626865 RepID=UPI000E73D5B0|nr:MULTISPECIES: TetR family transcriptional regulator [unclassified Achromobacter]AYD64474.1 TetR family transcriptional regulator [Achromobacter sp. B7]QYJ23919.1 TetR/AcrR family transcriptional regulator [Achromobacter sp. ES-001]
MRVTKAQAQANRAHIVETASTLFRERGYDGVGVAELMAAAGFTHGGFYKHFRSKADLMAETAASGLSQSLAMTGDMDPAKFVNIYLSRAHRDGRSAGCTMAALCGDAARQSDDVKTTFAAGIENMLAALAKDDVAPQDSGLNADPDSGAHSGAHSGANSNPDSNPNIDPSLSAKRARAKRIDLLAHVIGAVALSRACPDDSPLADEILEACRSELLASLASESPR